MTLVVDRTSRRTSRMKSRLRSVAGAYWWSSLHFFLTDSKKFRPRIADGQESSPRREMPIYGTGLGCNANRAPLSPAYLACGQRDALPLHRIAFALQNFEQCVLFLPPEANIEPLATQTQISQCHVRQPIRQRGIDIELAARRVLLQPQHRLQLHKRRSRRPGLGYVGAQILYGETRGVALQPAIKLRQLIQQEMACSAADVTSHRRRLCGKSVAPHAERD